MLVVDQVTTWSTLSMLIKVIMNFKKLLNYLNLYLQTNKVVVLEDLAAQFKLKTQFVIDRIQELQTEGRLTGKS